MNLDSCLVDQNLYLKTYVVGFVMLQLKYILVGGASAQLACLVYLYFTELFISLQLIVTEKRYGFGITLNEDEHALKIYFNIFFSRNRKPSDQDPHTV